MPDYDVNEAAARLLAMETNEAETPDPVEAPEEEDLQEPESLDDDVEYEASDEVEEEETEEVVEEEEVALPEGWDDFAELPAAKKKALLEKVEAERQTASRSVEEQINTKLAEKQAEYEKKFNEDFAPVKEFSDFALEVLISKLPPEPTRELAAEDPGEYVRQMSERKAALEQLQVLHGNWQQAQQAQKAEQAKKFTEWVAEQDKILSEALPEWKADKQATTKKLTEYAKSKGFDDERLAGMSATEAMILWKAKQWDDLQAKTPEVKKTIKEAPKVVKPGAKTVKSPNATEIDKLMAKARGNGLTTQEAGRLMFLKGQ